METTPLKTVQTVQEAANLEIIFRLTSRLRISSLIDISTTTLQRAKCIFSGEKLLNAPSAGVYFLTEKDFSIVST